MRANKLYRVNRSNSYYYQIKNSGEVFLYASDNCYLSNVALRKINQLLKWFEKASKGDCFPERFLGYRVFVVQRKNKKRGLIIGCQYISEYMLRKVAKLTRFL